MTDVNRTISMEDAIQSIQSGEITIALGGNSIHRVPNGFVRALAGRKDLSFHIVKTAGAYDIDLLCLTGRVAAVSAGFVGYETQFGLARHYRKAVESGRTKGWEHACYTVITALRAAAYGVGFLPVRGLDGSDLVDARGWQHITNPYDPEDRAVAIPAIRPDIAVLHVQVADRLGNGVIVGPKNEDLLMARAARRVFLTTERIVPTEALPVPVQYVDIPSVLVDGVIEDPCGAWPGSCDGEYDIDPTGVEALQSLPDESALEAYLSGLAGKTGACRAGEVQ
jgi:glutaconate CoA-transferase, subunit A